MRRFIAIEGTLQATVLGAQTFTSLRASARAVHQLFASAGETESAATWVSVVILLQSVAAFVV